MARDLPSVEKSSPKTSSAGSFGRRTDLPVFEIQQLELAPAGDVPDERGGRPRVVERERSASSASGALGEDLDLARPAVRVELHAGEGRDGRGPRWYSR